MTMIVVWNCSVFLGGGSRFMGEPQTPAARVRVRVRVRGPFGGDGNRGLYGLKTGFYSPLLCMYHPHSSSGGGGVQAGQGDHQRQTNYSIRTYFSNS